MICEPIELIFDGLKYYIGQGNPVFVIAEAGVNHNGDIKIAHELINAAVNAKANAVKFQTFNVDKLLTKSTPKADYQIRNTNSGDSQYEMLSALQLSEKDFIELREHCLESGIIFLSSPFDEESINLLSRINVPAIKIPSGELTNLPLLSYAAKLNIPMFVSTGMATLKEVDVAVSTILDVGNKNIVLLHCVSNYPAAASESNLRAMDTLTESFGIPVGFSDHTLGINVSLAAVAKGACIIEKHLTLDKKMNGPDHSASLSPQEFIGLVEGIRTVETAIGDGEKVMQPSESSTAMVARKSLVAAKDIPQGVKINASMVAIRRPGTGLSPDMLGEILSSVSKYDIVKGTVLKTQDFIAKDNN